MQSWSPTWTTGAHLLGPSVLLPRVCIRRKLEAEFSPSHSDMGCRCLNCFTKCLLPINQIIQCTWKSFENWKQHANMDIVRNLCIYQTISMGPFFCQAFVSIVSFDHHTLLFYLHLAILMGIVFV